MIDYICQSHSHRILEWNDSILNPYVLERYSHAITAKGSPLDNCFGFNDGTVRPISKPGENQRIVYNGHKRVHGIKFQSVALPNGLIGNMHGPVEGRRHDAGMLADSNLLQDMRRMLLYPGLCIIPCVFMETQLIQ